MRDLDIGRFLRLRGAILEAIDAIPESSRATSGTAMQDAYDRFREEALDIIPEEHREELERICPEWVEYVKRDREVEEIAEDYSEAKLVLRSLAGFLNAYAEETQMNLNAEAHAAAMLKSKRGVGF